MEPHNSLGSQQWLRTRYLRAAPRKGNLHEAYMLAYVALQVSNGSADFLSRSVAHHVSNAILAKPQTTRAWNHDAIFSKIPGDHSEIWGFTYLRSIVVGIHHSDLESTLLNIEYRNLINTPDAYGRTPLFWAALRGDHAKVTAILAAGADHTMTDVERRLPHHAAIPVWQCALRRNIAQTWLQRACSRQLWEYRLADSDIL
jgi:hypothetical protein